MSYYRKSVAFQMILCHRAIFHSSNCKALPLSYVWNKNDLEYFVLRASKCWHEKRHSWPTVSLRNTFRTRLTVHTITTSLDLNSAHFHCTVYPIWMEQRVFGAHRGPRSIRDKILKDNQYSTSEGCGSAGLCHIDYRGHVSRRNSDKVNN